MWVVVCACGKLVHAIDKIRLEPTCSLEAMHSNSRVCKLVDVKATINAVKIF